MGATIANDGINPRTGVRALAAAHVPDVLTVMNMCGMYNYAGQWSLRDRPAGQERRLRRDPAGDPRAGRHRDLLAADRRATATACAASPRAARDRRRLRPPHLRARHPNVRNVIRAEYRGDRLRSKRARRHAELRAAGARGRAHPRARGAGRALFRLDRAADPPRRRTGRAGRLADPRPAPRALRRHRRLPAARRAGRDAGGARHDA